MICCFFGHRDAPDEIKEELRQTVLKLFQEHPSSLFLVGDSGNFDRMTRSVLQDMKRQGLSVQYEVVLSRIPQYQEGEDYSDTVFPQGLENVPAKFAITHRNRWMLKQADTVICYIRYPFGGAAQCVDQARRRGLKIVEL